MKDFKIFYSHLVVGVLYLTLITLATWNVSGGDISFWIFAMMSLSIHLVVVLMTQKRKPGFMAWLLILGLTIATSVVSNNLYLTRDYEPGIKFESK